MAKAKKKASIKVTLARLSSPIEVKSVEDGTTLDKFLQANKLSYSASIRVNAKTAGKTYKLHKGDIICIVARVSGGK